MSLQPIECKYVTEDLVREWKNASATANLKPSGPVPMLRFLYELCWNMVILASCAADGVRGELPFQKCKVILDSVLFSDNQSKEDLDSVLADIVSQMGQDHTMPGDCRARLAKMVIDGFAKWLVESTLVPLRLFQERCEEEFLWESEMIKIKAQDLKLKEVRANTRLLYQQTKFNLLREESEGYAKLVTLLCQSGLEASTQNTSTTIISTIKSHASQILGFKFQYYQRMEVNTPVPFGLFRLTALLILRMLGRELDE
ncbi:hypothetical protein QJS10_CPA09g00274 [Acorus calamus]|uniref:THO complex subunit 2 N-terminal domain-containing protein n=1 Tax=Acorus calamus TaxID=4465 RepID=A0AAV9E4T8_ACOCL|nr:hypothetical protein QJS10_CPA09g00274 [Acorus calamus]